MNDKIKTPISGFTVIRFLSLAIGLLLSTSLLAENIVTSGTTIRVTAGTSLVSSTTLIIQNGGTLNNLGTVVLSGNLNNLNASASNLGTGTISMSGTSTQAINGQNIFGNLTLNNATGVNLNGNATLNGALTFTTGRLILGSNNLLLGTSATIAGAPSSVSMVVAIGTGQLRKSFTGTGSFTFPVGDNTGTAEYTPVTANFTSGSFGSGNYIGVNLSNEAYPGASGSYLNRYWNVTQSGITDFSCNSTFKYMQADVVGTEALVYCIRVNPTSVVYFDPTNATTDILTANNLAEFGTFTGLQQLPDKTLSLTALLEGLYSSTGTMFKAKNATGDQFPGLTADQISFELRNLSTHEVVYAVSNLNLSTSGLADVPVPGVHSGSYYLVIRHRNSIETWSNSPVSFTTDPVTYNFSSALSQAFGNNLKPTSDGYFTVFGGDINQDGTIDIADMTQLENAASIFENGYIVTDVNGDGTTDIGDMTIVDNNSANFISVIAP